MTTVSAMSSALCPTPNSNKYRQ